MLSGGDERSIGRAGEVVELVRREPKAAAEVIACLWDPDRCVRMRAADVAEKVSREQPVLIEPYRKTLLGLLTEETQPAVQWHLTAILPRLRLTRAECVRAATKFRRYLESSSSIVKTSAMQGLFDLTTIDDSLRPMVLDLIRSLTRTGTPAMRARGRILLKQLEAGG
jgi:hypothetical protein